MKRRTFILGGLGVGSALVVGWGVMPPRSRLGSNRLGAASVANTEAWFLNGWIKVYADGTVGVVVPRAEMGQGVHTALPMLAAEEMEVPFERFRVEPAGTDAIYGNVAVWLGSLPFHPDSQDSPLVRLSEWLVGKAGREFGVQLTGGSSSVRDAWLPLRQAGAVARSMLLLAAARRWRVPPEQCRMDQGRVLHTSGRHFDIGELALSALQETPPREIALRPASAFKLLATPAPRLDVVSKVNGSAVFGADVRLPGLLYAAVRFCPVVGGALISMNGDAVRVRPGVVRVSAFAANGGAAAGVAVVARDSWTALSAVQQVQVRWHEGEHATLNSADLMQRMRHQLDDFDGLTFYKKGEGEAALTQAARVVRADYSAPWLAHATMEPMNCTAQFQEDGSLQIWAPTQVASMARDVAARVAGIDVDRVHVHVTLLGGGFGRRLESDFIAVAVQVARDVAPAPVQVLWSREEDLAHDFYRPAAVARLQAGLDAQGQPQTWVTHSVADAIVPQYAKRAYPALALELPDKTTAEGLSDQAYEFTHRSSAHQVMPTPLPVGNWRSVGYSYNAFFAESFIDEIAHATQRDPLQFRLDLLKAHPRHRAVLELAARQAGWGTPLPEGRARGLALHESYGTIVAQVAEVSLLENAPRVHRVVCALDCGVVVNPNIVAQQMEGGILFGLTAALFGEITWAQGRVQQSNFAQYRIALLRDSPRIETHIVPSQREPTGAGEPGVPPIAPAIANALFALTGQRLRALPLRLKT